MVRGLPRKVKKGNDLIEVLTSALGRSLHLDK